MERLNIESDNENYIIRQPKIVFWIGVICAVLFSIPLIIAAIFGSEDCGLFEIIVFSSLSGLGVFFAVYAAKWKIIAEKDVYNVFMPFRPSRTITLKDITSVKQKYNGIVIYTGEKAAFAVDSIVIGFDIFRRQLYEAGKMESTQCKNSFVVRQHKGNIVVGILSMPLGIGALIWGVIRPEDFVQYKAVVIYGYYIFFLGFTILSLYLIIHSIVWKLTVSENTLTVKRIAGSEKEYSIRDITKVSIGKEKITLYIEDKKIVKVADGCGGFPTLVERLNSEKVPFYYKEKLIEKQK